MNVLTYTTLYPNAAQPHHGVFVEHRVRRLAESGRARVRVVAPVPWFPSASPRFGRYAVHARAPREEVRHGLDVCHPRYPVIPKVGMLAAPWLLERGTRAAVARIVDAGPRPDVLDAHFFYPDGVAAALLARRFGLPLVITARGTDVNLYPRLAIPRRLIRWAADRADAVITVCEALREALIELGVAPEKVHTLRNGVDLELFRPRDREPARAALGLSGLVLLSVGHLIERKGHDIAVRALTELPDASLVVIGEGPERGALGALARSLGVADRVRFEGARPQPDLPAYYSAADALVLASSREGWANVLLESMACGTPVVATRIWGTPEVVREPAAGVLMEARDPGSLARAVRRLLRARPERAATRRYAERFDWGETTAGQLELFERVRAARAGAGAAPLGAAGSR